jgi:membrane protein
MPWQGGGTAAILFEMAKYGFAVYVKAMPGFQTIYGALAVIPIFLVWIYTSWVVLILGAHITFCLSAFQCSSEKLGKKDHNWSFDEVYNVIYLLWIAQKDGITLSSYEIRKAGMRTPQHQINEIMSYLQSANWVQNTGNGNWILSRDMDEVTILDLVKAIPRQIPMEPASKNVVSGRKNLDKLFNSYQQTLEENLSVPVSKLLQERKNHTSG